METFEFLGYRLSIDYDQRTISFAKPQLNSIHTITNDISLFVDKINNITYDFVIPFENITAIELEEIALEGIYCVEFLYDNKRLYFDLFGVKKDATIFYGDEQLNEAIKKLAHELKLEINKLDSNDVPHLDIKQTSLIVNKTQNEIEEHIMKCDICDNIYCYTSDDVARNDVLAKLIKVMRIVKAGKALAGKGIAASLTSNLIRFIDSQIFQYKRCPVCRSIHVKEINQTELAKIKLAKQSSPADEILKYKKLFDQKIITKKEFNTKKKELLNLQ